MGLQAITANRLTDGLVVFYGSEGGWVDLLSKAKIVDSAEEAEKLLASVTKATLTEVVGPYLIDVLLDKGNIVAERYREQIRVQGPTVRVDLGYQAR